MDLYMPIFIAAGALILLYIVIARFIVSILDGMVKYMAMSILFLIPTWDIIIGYPLYKYLCSTKHKNHIYQRQQNVKGIYVGGPVGGAIMQSTPLLNFPLLSPEYGYEYIDYYNPHRREKLRRMEWVECHPRFKNSRINRKMRELYPELSDEHCLIEKAIQPHEQSRWEVVFIKYAKDGYTTYPYKNMTYEMFGIHELSERIYDRLHNEVIAEHLSYTYNRGWLVNTVMHYAIDYSVKRMILNKALPPQYKAQDVIQLFMSEQLIFCSRDTDRGDNRPIYQMIQQTLQPSMGQ
jgi:hypothetical protein